MSRFQIGQRVLILQDEQWWPAKVFSPEEQRVTLSTQGSLLVQFYGYDKFHEVPENSTVEPFDDNPRLLSLPEEFRGVLQLAEADEFALKINDPVVVKPKESAVPKRQHDKEGAKRTRPPTSNSSQVRRAPRKEPPDVRIREAESKVNSGATKIPASDSDLVVAKEQLEEAIKIGDVATARSQLLNLSRLSVTFQQLKETKIGVAVSSLLRTPSMEHLSGLARVLIRIWVQVLPPATQTAIRNHAAAQHEPTRVGEFANGARKEHFSQRLRNILSDCTDESLLVAVEDVATELERAALSFDERKKLIQILSDPGHAEIKRQLLAKKLSAQEFFQLRGDSLLTEEQRLEKQKLADEALAAKDKAAAIATSDMFECPKCQARKCTYYQQQTRGGDEPMTVFIKCCSCNWNWIE